MIIEDEFVLEHFGKKGMRWGVRNKVNQVKNIKVTPKEKKAAVISAGIGASFIAGRILGRRGHISIMDANKLANEKAGRAVREVGYEFVKGHIDKQLVLNYGRQVREGLVKV